MRLPQTSKASGITSGGQVYSRISYIGPIFRSPSGVMNGAGR